MKLGHLLHEQLHSVGGRHYLLRLALASTLPVRTDRELQEGGELVLQLPEFLVATIDFVLGLLYTLPKALKFFRPLAILLSEAMPVCFKASLLGPQDLDLILLPVYLRLKLGAVGHGG